MTKTLLLLLIVWTCLPLFAQKIHEKKTVISEQNRTASDARSFMELFSKLENGVALDTQQRNGLALERILAPEFIVRSAENPEHPMVRADWIQQVLSSSSMQSCSLAAFTIRAFATEAVVSYVQSQQAASDRQNCTGEIFVVDLWVVNHGEWQLAARYTAPTNRQVK
jgi:hypothetical protein